MSMKFQLIYNILLVMSLILVPILFVIYMIFSNLYTYSFVGESSVTLFIWFSRIEMIAYFGMYLCGSIFLFLFGRAVFLDKYENKLGYHIKLLINFIFIPIIIICLFFAWEGYESNIWTTELQGSNYDDFKYDRSLMKAAEFDLNNDAIIEIQCTDLKKKFFAHDSSHKNMAYVLECNDKDNNNHKFRLGPKDNINISEGVYRIEYYERSHFIKSITLINNTKVQDSLKEKVEITVEGNKNAIIINRPEMSQEEIDKNLFWYISKNGEFNECFQAYRKTWTNFLTFADEGNYTVTLVTDYDDATGEYTAISNTIEYTVE